MQIGIYKGFFCLHERSGNEKHWWSLKPLGSIKNTKGFDALGIFSSRTLNSSSLVEKRITFL